MPSERKLEPANISKELTISSKASSSVKIDAIYRLASTVPSRIIESTVNVIKNVNLKNRFARGTLFAPIQFPISPPTASDVPSGN